MKYILIIIMFYGCVKSYSQTTVTVQTGFNGFHCDGKQGLCSIDNQSDRALSNATLTLLNNQLTIKIDRNKLSASDEMNIYGKTTPVTKDIPAYFNVSESFVIPEVIMKYLTKSKTMYKIKNGAYLITTSDDFISVTFNLE